MYCTTVDSMVAQKPETTPTLMYDLPHSFILLISGETMDSGKIDGFVDRLGC
jgi:hypothetical protein